MRVLILAIFLTSSANCFAQSFSIGISVGTETGRSDFIRTSEFSPYFKQAHSLGVYWSLLASYEFRNKYFVEGEYFFAENWSGARIDDGIADFVSVTGSASGFQSLRMGFPLNIGPKKRLSALLGVVHHYNNGSPLALIALESYENETLRYGLYRYKAISQAGSYFLGQTGVRYRILDSKRSMLSLQLIGQFGFKHSTFVYYRAKIGLGEYTGVIANKHDLLTLSLLYQFRLTTPR